MQCTVCGARMSSTATDLPFKLSEERIVILKQLPVLQCTSCREYLIEDLDEKAARQVAKEYGFKVTGLLGLLSEAARLGLLNFPEAIERLQKTNFRASPRLLKLLLDRYEKEEKTIKRNA